jgi:hypothetical protein
LLRNAPGQHEKSLRDTQSFRFGGIYGAGFECNTPILNEACTSFGAFTTFQIVKERIDGSLKAAEE